jgi:hypothetical protein
MEHSLDIVAVRVPQERGVVAWVIVALARRTVVLAARRQTGFMEALHRLLVPGLESQVNVAGGLAHVDPQLVGEEVVAAVGDRHADGAQHGLVEALHGVQLVRSQMDVVDQATAMNFHG